MSDFNSTEFVVGTAKGLRVFRADSLGRLTGWTHRQIWTPGENIATCKKGEPDKSLASMYSYVSMEYKAPEPCPEPTPECGCGFWAYHSGTPDFGSTDGVVGIIEGYGKTTIGTKGFRASKARILAFAFPKSSCGCDHDLPFAQTPEVEALVRRNYPDVPTFDSLTAMTAEFPPDKPELPTPDDAEFWTMPDPAAEQKSVWGSLSGVKWGASSPSYHFTATPNMYYAPMTGSFDFGINDGSGEGEETEDCEHEETATPKRKWWRLGGAA